MNKYVSDAEANKLWDVVAEGNDFAGDIAELLDTRAALLEGIEDALFILRAVADQNAIPKDERTAAVRAALHEQIAETRALAAQIREGK